MKTIESNYGVVYNDSTKFIKGIKTPSNKVFPSNLDKVFECDTEDELNVFINENELKYEEFTGEDN